MLSTHHAARESGDAADPVVVRGGSRLHFGLFSFGRTQGHQYGGVGLMVESPAVHVRFRPAAQFQVIGLHTDRLALAAEQWQRAFGEPALPRCQVELAAAPPQHIGLGSGTQLACAVAAGLSAWTGRAISSPLQLARATGRATRSAIGTHGFLRGGLILDDGKREEEVIGRLAQRLAFPAEWPIVLLWPRQADARPAMHGAAEREAFRSMPPVPRQREEELRRIAVGELLPAVEALEFEKFGEALYHYNRLAGECYREFQGSAYATDMVAELIGQLRERGPSAVGQSSWGPLVFAILPSKAEALVLQDFVEASGLGQSYACHMTQAANAGAQVQSRTDASGGGPLHSAGD